MKRTQTYHGLFLQAILILPEEGFLAGSKDDVVDGENTEVIIDHQDGDITTAISFDNWE